MAKLSIQNSKIKYDVPTKTFSVGGIGIPFGTKHSLTNEQTCGLKDFDFSHSTGSEWDVDTKWIYKSLDGYTLEIGNEDVTQEQRDNYMNAKMR